MSVEQADVIVEGQVVDTTSAWVEDQRGRHIYTTVTLRVSQVLKGDAQPEIKFEVIGGTVGEITERVSDTPIFSQNMQAVVFLRQAPLRLIPGEGAMYQVRDGKVHAENRELSVKEFTQLLEALGARKAADRTPASDVRLSMGTKTDINRGQAVTEILAASDIGSQRFSPVVTVPAADQVTLSAMTLVTASTWQTIKSENFDGAWPNDWQLSSNYTYGGIPITWAPETYVYCGSSPKGGWPHASAVDPNLYYFMTANPPPAPPIQSWMVYGPFSLSDATDAKMTFNLKYQLGAGDSVGWYASTNGTNFYGSGITGGSNASCSARTFDLKTVPTLGNLCGQASVWVAFYCSADAVQDYVRGPFIDDIVVSKYAGASGPPPTITTIVPGKASAGTSSTVTITGTNFGASQGSSNVEFFYRTGQPKIQAPIIAWSDAQIVCTVPTAIVNGYPASSGSGPVTVTTSGGVSNSYTFKVTFGYGGVRWGTSGGQTVGYRINENTSDCTGEGAAVQAAATTWGNACAAFSFRYDGACSSTTSTYNGVNEVMWGTTGGSLATTYYWYSGSQLLEADIVLDDSWSWSTNGASGTYDIQTTAVHELGHWLNLRDLYGDILDYEYDTAKIMYGYGSSGTTKRNLHTDDGDGIRWIYGLLSAPTNPIASPSTICAGSSTALSAVPGIGGDTIAWYSGSCGGTYVGTGNPLSVSPTGTTTYYAKTKNSTAGCLSSSCATGVTVTVNPLPVAPTSASNNGPIRSGSSATLTATGGSGATCKWYSDPGCTTSVGTGTSISVSPTSTTTYYVRWETTTCGNSSTKNTTVIVDDTPPVISDVLPNPGTTTCTVTWTTDEPATSQVEYGLTSSYGSETVEDTNLVTSHSVNLAGLSRASDYEYRVKSKDAATNPAVSDGYAFFTILPPNSIGGYVRACSGTPIADATVAITGVPPSVTTDVDGWYIFSDVAPGTYDLTASKTGFIPRTYTNQRMKAGDVLYENFALGDTMAISPTGTVSPGWSFISIPLEPVNPDPAVVFAGLTIHWRLLRFDRATQSQIPYDEFQPDLFGNMQTDEGYWLFAEDSYPISYQAYGGTPAMRDTALPTAGASFIGSPFLKNAAWEDIQVTHGGVTTSMQHAAKDLDKLWLNSIAIWFDSATQSQYTIGLPEDYQATTETSPWYGYWVNTYVNDLMLTIIRNRP